MPPPELVGESRLDVTDFAFARKEDEDVAWAFAHKFLAGVNDSRDLIDGFSVVFDEGAVPDFHGVRAPGDFYDGSVEMLSKTSSIDGCGGDDDFKVRASGEEPREVSEEEIDVE